MYPLALAHRQLHLCWQVPGTWYRLIFISFREGGQSYLSKQTDIVDTSSTAKHSDFSSRIDLLSRTGTDDDHGGKLRFLTINNKKSQDIRIRIQQLPLSNKLPDERTWSKKSQSKAISASRHCAQEAHTIAKIKLSQAPCSQTPA